jgi:hypothetical protein
MSNEIELKNKASADIAQILKQLESDTGMLVEDISLVSTEITGINSVSPEFSMAVRIDMVRLPGHKW